VSTEGIEAAGETRVYVCVTCRREDDPDPVRAGARLHAALLSECADDSSVAVIPVECLSVCRRPCTVSFAAPGKWTYVYGDLPPETSAATVRHAAVLYAGTADGLIPWKLRPEPLKKGVVARIPPLPA
jgi:predicted metal-binding protein